MVRLPAASLELHERVREGEERVNMEISDVQGLTSSVGCGCTSCFPTGGSMGNFDPRRCCRCGVVAMVMKEWRLLLQHVDWHWADSHTTDRGQAR